MPSMVASSEEMVIVESGVFGLMDVDTLSCPTPWPEDLLQPGDGVLARTDRVDFESAARDHLAAVRLEAWNGEPPPGPAEWAAEFDDEEIEVTLSSGTVRLWELTGGGSPQTFEVGSTGRYGLRIYCQGRQEVAELEATGRPIPEGTERYLLQFWQKPAAA